MSDEDHRLRNRLLVGLLSGRGGPKTWAPVVPRDMTARPPEVSAEGMAACEQCLSRFPLVQLEITAHGYRCAGCATSALVQPLPTSLKVGRGRWWIMPIVFAIVGAFVFIAPAVALVVTVVGALIAVRLLMRRGI